MTLNKALKLVNLGLPVFPVELITEPGSTKIIKKPTTRHGLKDATLDPDQVEKWWTRTPDALVGVHTGRGDIVVLDLDVKYDTNGTIIKDGFDSVDAHFLDVPPTYSYQTVGGEGQHYVYLAPAGVTLNGQADYRKMSGVDRRGGESYVVWAGDAPNSRDEFTNAPTWLCDPVQVRSLATFEGDLKAWYDDLEPGEPNVLVRNAISRISDDMSHSEMVSAQHEAIRLGAEGNPGVPHLISALEDAWISRDPALHGTPETVWGYKFQEALTSGIKKHGAAIQLRKDVPTYNISLIPSDVPDSLINRAGGDKSTFNSVLATLTRKNLGPHVVTSILWNAPSTRDLAHEWGLEFVHGRVLSALERPEPVRENPAMEIVETPADVKPVVQLVDDPEDVEGVNAFPTTTSDVFLTPSEQAVVDEQHTFIDDYLAASASKGYHNAVLDRIGAWTCLSMAFGRKAFIKFGKPLELNLWFIGLGYSGTGKSASLHLTEQVLDLMLKDGETYYNLGAKSTPEGLQLGFLERDGKPSMVLHDEAADFFHDLKTKDYMKALEDSYSHWYEGKVNPSNKISLKDMRGKGAITSFNVLMLGTPKRMTDTIETSMFASGFAARVNWVWAPPPADNDAKYKVTFVETTEDGLNPHVHALVADLIHAASVYGPRTAVDATDEARLRIMQAHKAFDVAAKRNEHYETIEPAITRLGRETVWKCATLLALWRGSTQVELVDALVAIHYATEWFHGMIQVADATSSSAFARDTKLISTFVGLSGSAGVSRAKLAYKFRNLIQRSPRELDDRINFLVDSGQMNAIPQGDGVVKYVLNGG